MGPSHCSRWMPLILDEGRRGHHDVDQCVCFHPVHSSGIGTLSNSVVELCGGSTVMTEEILDQVFGALKSVAPEIEDQPIDPKKMLRDQIEIDSMDFLNFVNALRAAFGIDVPEDAYPRLASIDGCVRYLKARGF